ncbi:MAG: RhuM family protein [Sulfurimonas sp.]|jgi:hypothetical protein|uniref:virulence RhuM family protein n=1 Tax=Sulfurimonas sp. TaxID=2022749 RepID=UPI003567C67D
MNNQIKSDIIIYKDINGEIKLDVSLENDTVWLSQKQMSLLFDVNVPAINKHIKNILADGELNSSTISKMEIVQKEGKREVKREVEFYNLDMIISLGYRVNSKRATTFRVWATKVLKEYLVNGYAINQKRLEQKGLKELNKTISLLQNTISQSELELHEAKGLLDVILNYSRTWSLLQGYDEDSLHVNIEPKEAKFVLDFDEAKEAIAQLKSELMRKGEATELFGHEKAGEFGGMVRNIYQTLAVSICSLA